MTSPRHSVLTDDVQLELAQQLNKKFQVWRGERSFLIESFREFGAVLVHVTLRNADESFDYPVEARIDFAAEEMDAQEAALFLIDYIDLYFSEFFEEDEGLFIPIDWSPYEYEAIEFEMRGQIHNRVIERMADEILAGNSASIQ